MKIRIRKHFPVTDLLFTVALICIVSYALLEHVTISIGAFSTYKLPILYLGAACILSQINLQIKSFTKKKYFFVWMWVLALCAVLIISLQVNRDPVVGVTPVRTTIRLVLYLLELFALMIWCAEEGRGRYVIKFIYYYLLILAIVTDFLLLTQVIVFRNDNHVSYLVGTKFSVSYLHMNLLAFWALKRQDEDTQKHSRINVVLAIVLVGISVVVNCVTGVLGALALLYFLRRSNVKYRGRFLRMSSPSVLILMLIGSVIFPVIAGQIISIPVVTRFITNVLGRSNTLTGRLNIFEIFGDKMEYFWLWGCGVGNANAASLWLFGYDNAQNAIFQWLLQAGMFATVFLCGMMSQVFRQLAGSDKREKLFPLIVLIYVYIIMGAVETTFNMSFIMWFALVFMLINEKTETNENECSVTAEEGTV
jgi:hypothetical protein